MSTGVASPILTAGGPPPQLHLLPQAQHRTGDDLLLLAAWAHGMAAEGTVHRYTLFAFVQTHLKAQSEEQMQATVESSANWVAQGQGKYKLTQAGVARIAKLFGPNPPSSSLTANYVLTRQTQGKVFEVEIRPSTRKLAVTIDGRSLTGVKACGVLQSLRETFITMSNSANTKVWNWIVQGGTFTWRRLS